jgi:exosortase family protein XrtF
MKLVKEFWPAIKFLLIFVGIYFLANVIYGIYIEYCYPLSDSFTDLIASQTSWILKLMNEPVLTQVNNIAPTVLLFKESKAILDIYEGCNGINVIIVFVAFIMAFEGKFKNKLPFIAIGVLIINVANVLRITLLYYVAIDYQLYFYFIHKYVFTLTLYVIVVILWLVYINRFNEKRKSQRTAV